MCHTESAHGWRIHPGRLIDTKLMRRNLPGKSNLLRCWCMASAVVTPQVTIQCTCATVTATPLMSIWANAVTAIPLHSSKRSVATAHSKFCRSVGILYILIRGLSKAFQNHRFSMVGLKIASYDKSGAAHLSQRLVFTRTIMVLLQ